MLVAPAMGPTIVRSSLEVMLDTLRQRDEKPKDLMPALPARPISKGRLPPSRRSLPSKFNIGSNGMDANKKKEVSLQVKIFGGKNFSNVEQAEESPYATMPESARFEERRPEQGECSVPSGSPFTSRGTKHRTKLNCNLIKDTRVWCGLQDAKWELGSIQAQSEDAVHVKTSDDKVLTVSSENVLPANPQILDGVDDLIQLIYLNEPSVLHNLQYRYSRDIVYTKAGPVLVALNPFKEVSLYGNDFVTAYRQKLLNCPHVFEIADTAYNEMMIDGKNQSIILSGESGAGKSETAKFAMQYLAALGGGSGMEDEVMLTNLILESFGNAKTLRNDNSSRFGKLIEIQFSADGKICGAKIQTFLLEKSRVVQRAMGERSFHVLYQLCAGASPHLKEKLNLKEASEYEYLKQSNCLTIADVDDAHRFHMLMEALDIVKICKEDQENAFAMLATVLWLGNIGFSVIDNENHVEVDLSEGVNNAAKLMGCEVSDLMLALSARKLKIGTETIVQKLTLSEAIDTRDALAKAIYASLFDWLVEELNKSLEAENSCAERSITILDIYGFESFNRNSFEQLCINYANERLQQHFNRHLFILEQEEYSQNGIEWKFFDFVDNTECLNLFEKKQMGLLSLLDEETTTPRATDMTFANKLKQNLGDNCCFKGERGGAFRISHFAGEVLYNSSGFLEKNRDLLHSDFIQLLSSSCCRFSQLIASHMRIQLNMPDNPIGELDGGDSQKKSVGAKFKDQIFKLMQQLESTTPHFIRCITPNSQHLPGTYQYGLVLQQIRCCGVLEVVRISRSVYPMKVAHQQFAERYGFFLLENGATQDPLTVSVNILRHFNVSPDMYQVGYIKIFFRTGQIAALEEVRHRTLRGIVCVQKHFHGAKARRSFQEFKDGVTVLQSFIRGVLGRKQFGAIKTLKRTKAFKHQELLDTEEQPQVVQTDYEEFQIRALAAETALKIKEEENLTSKQQIQHKKDTKEQPQVVHTDYDEFQRRALAAEAALRIKEGENLTLKQQTEQYETRWSDHEGNMKRMEEMWQKQLASLQDTKEQPQVVHADYEEFQRRALAAEVALRIKEGENLTLKQQIKQYETRWSDHEGKMKRMEEMWQKQLASLQMSLAEAKKSLAADDKLSPPRTQDTPTNNHNFDTEETMSADSQTPEGTPSQQLMNSESSHSAVGHMVKEFEQQKQVFEDDARFLIEVKSGQSPSNVNPEEDLQKLKTRFAAWKKDFKVKLRDTKMTIQKLGGSNSRSTKTSRKWWNLRATK